MMRGLKGGRRSHKAWRDGGRLTFKKRDSEGRHWPERLESSDHLQIFHDLSLARNGHWMGLPGSLVSTRLTREKAWQKSEFDAFDLTDDSAD